MVRQLRPEITTLAWLALALTFLTLATVAHEATKDRVILAPGYSVLTYEAPKAGTYKLPKMRLADDAVFIDSHNQTGSLKDLFNDKVTILSFIYTGCDDANGCPLATFVMSKIAKGLEADAAIREHAQLVSFSFDLHRDTPEVLENYGKSFRTKNVSWAFVGSPNQESLKRTLTDYDQSIQELAGHKYAHLLRVFLIDGKNRIRNIYSTSFLHHETIINDIKTVLAESSTVDYPRGSRSPISRERKIRRNSSGSGSALGLPADFNYKTKPELAALGAELFFDRRLSINNTISCATCHIPSQGFTSNEVATPIGFEGRTVRRNAPSLLNVGYLSTFFHDARESKLEEQVWSPLLASNEMANPSIGYVVQKIKRLRGYKEKFQAQFEKGITRETIGLALAAYQRSLIAGGSAFDYYYYLGQIDALDVAERRGFELFRGKANCVACHLIERKKALFTDQKTHNTGIGYFSAMIPKQSKRRVFFGSDTVLEYDLSNVAASAEPPPTDLGRYEVTLDPKDRWRYKTPGLRNVALTAPYMHDGSMRTIEEVVEFYSAGGISNRWLDPLVRPLDLSRLEKSDLVSFLKSLTSRNIRDLVAKADSVVVGNP